MEGRGPLKEIVQLIELDGLEEEGRIGKTRPKKVDAEKVEAAKCANRNAGPGSEANPSF